jgi:hypothetical protein
MLLGMGPFLIPIPRALWQRGMRAAGRQARASLSFMSEDHHRVRDFAVLELARTGMPLSPSYIADALAMEPARVDAIIEKLEKRKTFLFRSDGTHVTWAYPVTVDETPHRAIFETGEEAYSP